MLQPHGKTLLVCFAGLLLGGLSSYAVRASRSPAVSEDTAVSKMDMTRFSAAGSIEAGVALARQLPAAAADQCAALAQAMLAKRVKVTIPVDPFSDKKSLETREEYLPERAWEGLFKRWMKVAPQAAWEFVMVHHSEELPLRIAALRQWALIDPAAAVHAAGSLSSEEKKLILDACVESEPAIGLKLLAEWGLEHGHDRNDDFFTLHNEPTLVEKLLMRFAEQSASAAMQWSINHAPALSDFVCVGWMRKDPSGCMEWIKARDLSEQQHLMTTICEQADASASSVRYLASLCEPEQRWDWIDRGLLAIAQRDEFLAQSLIDELLLNPADRLVARSEIANQIAETDPRKAIEFILPALRQALPLFDSQNDLPFSYELPSAVGGAYDPFASGYSGLTSVVRSYIELGPAAGVGKNEVLDLLGQIHPQYYACLMDDIIYQLQEALGPAAEWIEPYTAKMSREQIASIVDHFDYSSPEEARHAALSIKAGPLRDALVERYLSLLLESNSPIASILESAREIGGNRVDMGEVYGSWVNTEPEAALKHLAHAKNLSANEWQNVIMSGYGSHATEIQNLVEKLPAGQIRNAASMTLADAALAEGNDFVTSLYWATEISTRTDRAKMIRGILKIWSAHQQAVHDAEIIEGMRANIGHSALDSQEKALWLERIESEVPR